LPQGEGRLRRFGDVCQVEVMCAARVERFGDGERAVPEVRLRCEQLDVDQVGRKCAQSQQRLQAGDAAACDENAEAAVRSGVFGFHDHATAFTVLRAVQSAWGRILER